MGKRDRPSGGTASDGLAGALGTVARRLKSQPLVFAFGVILILAIVGSRAVEALRFLLIPAVIIFMVGLGVWLASEFLRRGRGTERSARGVDVHARDVSPTGSVVGIEGLPAKNAAPGNVQVSGQRIEGAVRGVVYDKRDDDARGKPKR
jgi:hypothetical protein